MNTNYSQNVQSPRYVEIDANGQVLRHSSVLPPEVQANLSASQGSMTYNTPPSHPQWSNYSQKTPYNKNWYQSVGPFNPYRTWNQEYGRLQKQSNSMSNVYYAGSNVYVQNPSMNYGGSSSYNTTSYPGQNSMY